MAKQQQEELATGIRSAGGKAIGLACNVARETALEALVAGMVTAFGRPNAGGAD